MVYKVVSTDEMDVLLDKCVMYLLKKFKSEQAASHLLDGVSEVYDNLENNPLIYRISEDPFMKELNYREAKVPEMDYLIIYKIVGNTVYLLGIFHSLENYAGKMKVLWDSRR